MDNAELIARLMGPVMLAAGIGIALNRVLIADMMGQARDMPVLVFIGGILSLLAGVAILNAHHAWTGDWRVLVTLMGWLAVAGGVLRLFAPGAAIGLGEKLRDSAGVYFASALFYIAVGAVLCFYGYFA